MVRGDKGGRAKKETAAQKKQVGQKRTRGRGEWRRVEERGGERRGGERRAEVGKEEREVGAGRGETRRGGRSTREESQADLSNEHEHTAGVAPRRSSGDQDMLARVVLLSSHQPATIAVRWRIERAGGLPPDNRESDEKHKNGRGYLKVHGKAETT
eukprot:763978-Hanusia_phi.AAC.2